MFWKLEHIYFSVGGRRWSIPKNGRLLQTFSGRRDELRPGAGAVAIICNRRSSLWSGSFMVQPLLLRMTAKQSSINIWQLEPRRGLLMYFAWSGGGDRQQSVVKQEEEEGMADNVLLKRPEPSHFSQRLASGFILDCDDAFSTQLKDQGIFVLLSDEILSHQQLATFVLLDVRMKGKMQRIQLKRRRWERKTKSVHLYAVRCIAPHGTGEWTRANGFPNGGRQVKVSVGSWEYRRLRTPKWEPLSVGRHSGVLAATKTLAVALETKRPETSFRLAGRRNKWLVSDLQLFSLDWTTEVDVCLWPLIPGRLPVINEIWLALYQC